MRNMYIGNLVDPTMRVTRENNGDVVIAGTDPNNMDRMNQTSIRMSAEEWELFVDRFSHIAQYI